MDLLKSKVSGKIAECTGRSYNIRKTDEDYGE